VNGGIFPRRVCEGVGRLRDRGHGDLLPRLIGEGQKWKEAKQNACDYGFHEMVPFDSDRLRQTIVYTG
jgi:hypothetical protein